MNPRGVHRHAQEPPRPVLNLPDNDLLSWRSNNVSAFDKVGPMEQSILEKRLDIHNSELPVLCQACEARHRGVCGALAPDQLIKLSRHTAKHVLQADQVVPASAPGSTRYSNILRGIVKLSKMISDGRQQIVGLQFAPDFLGRPFGASTETSAEAVTEVKVCSFPKSVLDALIRESPELERRLHQQSLRELDEAREWMLTLGRKTASEKVASFLCLLATHSDPETQSREGRVSFEIPLRRSDIADFLGLTIETVSRQLTKLRQMNVIVLTDNRLVEVPDLMRLKAMAEINV
jgi:CRP/FNR family transcriptional regulator, anaerobic regulatory protein